MLQNSWTLVDIKEQLEQLVQWNGYIQSSGFVT